MRGRRGARERTLTGEVVEGERRALVAQCADAAAEGADAAEDTVGTAGDAALPVQAAEAPWQGLQALLSLHHSYPKLFLGLILILIRVVAAVEAVVEARVT